LRLFISAFCIRFLLPFEKRKDLNERHIRGGRGGRWEEVCVRRAENGSGPCKCGQKVQARPLEIQAVQQQQQRRQQQWQ